MNGKSIGFVNEKGGVGKSTAAFNIAWKLSENDKVLLIDLDGQQANLTYFCGVEKTDDLKTIKDVLDEECTIDEAIIHLRNNLDIIPADISVSEIGQREHITQYVQSHGAAWVRKEFTKTMFLRMIDIFEKVKKKYKYVLCDVSPAPNFTHLLCLCGVDYVTVVMLPDAASLEGNRGTEDSIKTVIESGVNPDLRVTGILFNRNTDRTKLSRAVKTAVDSYAKRLNTTPFSTGIRNAVAMSECVAYHVGVTEYAPRQAVAEDIVKVTEELKERIR